MYESALTYLGRLAAAVISGRAARRAAAQGVGVCAMQLRATAPSAPALPGRPSTHGLGPPPSGLYTPEARQSPALPASVGASGARLQHRLHSVHANASVAPIRPAADCAAGRAGAISGEDRGRPSSSMLCTATGPKRGLPGGLEGPSRTGGGLTATLGGGSRWESCRCRLLQS